MKICENGVIRDMTSEEIAAMQAETARYEAQERHRLLTESEVSRLIIRQQINTLSVDDQTAVRMTEFYPAWESEQAYTAGYKVQYVGKLWRCIQAHTSQDSWAPSTDTASLWERIDETHTGDQYDPIPYEGNMALTAGCITVRTAWCISATGIPVSPSTTH